MLKSKRFLLTCISGAAFLIGVYIFHVEPIDLATGIGIILAPYLAAETYSQSKKL